jgi:PilZ domain-containing protein
MSELRRSRRVLATVPLEIFANGEVIPASTAVINLNGALILSSVKWPQGSTLKFRNPDNGVVVLGRVVWSGDVAPNGLHKLGVEFAQACPEIWGSHYDPNSTDTPESAAAEEAARATEAAKNAVAKNANAKAPATAPAANKTPTPVKR